MALIFDFTKIPHEITTEFWTSRSSREGKMLTWRQLEELSDTDLTSAAYVEVGGQLYYPHLTVITDAFVWALGYMLGVPSITDKNFLEVYVRIRSYEAVLGPIRTSGEFISLDDVKNHIGMSTNGTKRTSAQQCTHLRKILEDQINRKGASWEISGAA